MTENSTHKHLQNMAENPPVKDPKQLLKIATKYRDFGDTGLVNSVGQWISSLKK